MTNLNFSSLRENKHSVHELSSIEQLSELDDCLWVFDDTWEEGFNKKMIDLNTTHIVIIKSLHDVLQVKLFYLVENSTTQNF